MAVFVWTYGGTFSNRSSKKEIKTYLSKYYEEELVNRTINKLVSLGLINDSKYVYAYYLDRINLSNDGPNKIKDNLLKLGIKEDIINENITVDKTVIFNKLNHLIDKKIKTSKGYSGNILKQRLISYFINQGYDIDMINEIINTKNLTNIEEGIKEYNKLLNKYKNKYDDYKLEAYIRSKLYSRSSRSSIISIWRRPKKPHLNPKPKALLVSGSKDRLASLSLSFSKASRSSL